MSKLLSSEAIEATLAATPGWTRANNAITRTFTLPSFTAALTFAAAVGHLAERANHHPDILIQYRQVTLTLSTHDAGGLTDKDFKLAGEINALAA
ncbi:MAG: 4a-hydroxytetrahydrobiopterin dehydratase [Anaerolineae bacterium]